MKAHLRDQDIIDFKFRLCVESDAARIERHLNECPACKARADELLGTLGQLEILHAPAEASEKLITDTLRTIRLLEEPETFPVTRLLWLGGAVAAAALLVIAITLTPKSPQGGGIQVAQEATPKDVLQVASAPAVHSPAQAPEAETDDSALGKEQDAEPVEQEIVLAGALEAEAPAELADAAKLEEQPEVVAEPVAVGVQLAMAPAAQRAYAVPTAPPAGETRILVLASAEPRQAAAVTAPDTRLKAKKAAEPEGFRVARALRGRTADSFVSMAAPRRESAEAAPAAAAPADMAPAEVVIPEDTVEGAQWQFGPGGNVLVRRAGYAPEVEGGAAADGPVWRWRVSAVNTGDEPARVVFTREFASTNWIIQVSNEASLTVKDSRHAEIVVELPPQTVRSFTYSIRTPVLVEQP